MTLWRLHINTAAKPGFDPRQFCIFHNYAGVGWGVDELEVPTDLDRYWKLCERKYYDRIREWKPSLNAFGCRMDEGDLCWTRDRSGIYYLGRITGPWEYLNGVEATNFDIHCVRSCEWRKVGLIDSGTGKVETSFISPRAIQEIKDPTTIVYSAQLYSRMRGEPIIASSHDADHFNLLWALGHEDIAALYLQAVLDYVLVPNSVKMSTLAYEGVLYHRITGEKAVFQVKSGDREIDLAELAKLDCVVYVAASDVARPTVLPANVRWIARDQLRTFVTTHKHILPERVRRCMDWCPL